MDESLRNMLVKAPLLFFYRGENDCTITTSTTPSLGKDICIPLEEAVNAFPELFDPTQPHKVEAYTRTPTGGVKAVQMEAPLTHLPDGVIELVKSLGMRELLLQSEDDTFFYGRPRRDSDCHVGQLKKEIGTFKTKLRMYENMHSFPEPGQPLRELPALQATLSPLEKQLAQAIFEEKRDLTDTKKTITALQTSISTLFEHYQILKKSIDVLAPQITYRPYEEKDFPLHRDFFEKFFIQQTAKRKNDPHFRAKQKYLFEHYFSTEVLPEIKDNLVGSFDGTMFVSFHVPHIKAPLYNPKSDEGIMIDNPVARTMNVYEAVARTNPALQTIHAANKEYTYTLIAQSLIHHFEKEKAPALTISDDSRRYENYFLRNGFTHLVGKEGKKIKNYYHKNLTRESQLSAAD